MTGWTDWGPGRRLVLLVPALALVAGFEMGALLWLRARDRVTRVAAELAGRLP